MAQDWAGVKVTLFGEKEAYDHLGKECALWTLSHRGDLDWVIAYVVGCHYNFLHVCDCMLTFCMRCIYAVRVYVCVDKRARVVEQICKVLSPSAGKYLANSTTLPPSSLCLILLF